MSSTKTTTTHVLTVTTTQDLGQRRAFSLNLHDIHLPNLDTPSDRDAVWYEYKETAEEGICIEGVDTQTYGQVQCAARIGLLIADCCISDGGEVFKTDSNYNMRQCFPGRGSPEPIVLPLTSVWSFLVTAIYSKDVAMTRRTWTRLVRHHEVEENGAKIEIGADVIEMMLACTMPFHEHVSFVVLTSHKLRLGRLLIKGLRTYLRSRETLDGGQEQRPWHFLLIMLAVLERKSGRPSTYDKDEAFRLTEEIISYVDMADCCCPVTICEATFKPEEKRKTSFLIPILRFSTSDIRIFRVVFGFLKAQPACNYAYNRDHDAFIFALELNSLTDDHLHEILCELHMLDVCSKLDFCNSLVESVCNALETSDKGSQLFKFTSELGKIPACWKALLHKATGVCNGEPVATSFGGDGSMRAPKFWTRLIASMFELYERFLIPQHGEAFVNHFIGSIIKEMILTCWRAGNDFLRLHAHTFHLFADTLGDPTSERGAARWKSFLNLSTADYNERDIGIDVGARLLAASPECASRVLFVYETFKQQSIFVFTGFWDQLIAGAVFVSVHVNSDGDDVFRMLLDILPLDFLLTIDQFVPTTGRWVEFFYEKEFDFDQPFLITLISRRAKELEELSRATRTSSLLGRVVRESIPPLHDKFRKELQIVLSKNAWTEKEVADALAVASKAQSWLYVEELLISFPNAKYDSNDVFVMEVAEAVYAPGGRGAKRHKAEFCDRM